MTETETIVCPPTETKLDHTKSAFYLPRQTDSIFVGAGLKCREYPDMPLIYGFLHKQMGIKLRKHIAKVYPDEQTHYTNYIKKYNYDEDYIETKYYLPKHKWGRVNPFASLSLSLFHRPSRHSFAKKKYLDFDIINAQPQLLLELAKKEKLELTGGLEEYCADPKKCRYDIADYYKLKDITTEDGYCLTAYEQAKKLPIRLAFGGGIYTWKKEFVKIRVPDMPLIDNLMTDLVLLRNKIVRINPHIKTDLATENEDWNNKTAEEKDRSVMAFFAQTWERIIQEYCIADLVRTYNISLGDIIPSQDGFMPLEEVIRKKNIPVADLFDRFNRRVLKKFGLDIKWSEKGFDEAIEIKPSDIVPIDITLQDLELGEVKIAEKIYPALKNKLIYSSKTNLWYYTDKQNIWCKTKYANEYLISKTIQYYIKGLIDKYWEEYRLEDDPEEKKGIKKDIDESTKYFNSVGKSSYVGQTAKYLRNLLTDNNFPDKLDNTGGKIVFADGIFDLKTGEFNIGIRRDDYVSFTLSIHYPPDFDNKKMATLKKTLKKILNWNDEHLEYYLGVLGYAFCGDAHLEKSIYYIVDGTEGGRGDNGKTFFFDVLTHLFPTYVKQTDPKLLEASNTKTHKQLPELNGARIVWADEGTKHKLNAALMKKIGDGMSIDTDIMYGNTVSLKVSYKMFVCSNHIPKIDKDEEAVYNRYKQIQFCSHFDRTGCIEEENYETLDFIADTKLGDNFKQNYSDEIVSLILEYGMKYYDDGLPPIPQQFKDAVNKTKTENNEFAKWFYDNFEPKVGHNVSIYEMEDISSYKRQEIIKELSRIGIKWNKDLCSFYVKTRIKEGKEVKILGGIAGYSRILEKEDEV